MNRASGGTPAQGRERRRWERVRGAAAADPYLAGAEPPGAAICPRCKAVYRRGRWRWGERPAQAEELVCQACRRADDDRPAGILTLKGAFVAGHKGELIRLVRSQETAEWAAHPLNRLIAIKDTAMDQLVITTTDTHLARRLGKAIRRIYRGVLRERFDRDTCFMRADWRREE